jgi:hypothetical protein
MLSFEAWICGFRFGDPHVPAFASECELLLVVSNACAVRRGYKRMLIAARKEVSSVHK